MFFSVLAFTSKRKTFLNLNDPEEFYYLADVKHGKAIQGFPYMGVPFCIINFNRYKPSILGYPHFRNLPFGHT